MPVTVSAWYQRVVNGRNEFEQKDQDKKEHVPLAQIASAQ
jgi:hypothetical protein